MPARRVHQTRIRQRRGLTEVSCTCGWSEQSVSNFAAWLSSKRHADLHMRADHLESAPVDDSGPVPPNGAHRR